ncbi:hypothetical protein AB4Y36_38095 [Paraburkholderia sp. BR10936]|uniref:hypothetical protein n=1 Tax=Paraburkholderia sp. BR10936 TaxID=3236993 RepID=UPI0034D316BD
MTTFHDYVPVAVTVPDPPPDDPPYIDEDEGTYLGDALGGSLRDICPACGGSGGDPYNDGLLPCTRCGGEGWYWYRT